MFALPELHPSKASAFSRAFLLLALFFGLVSGLPAYVLEGFTWPEGSNIAVKLQLGDGGVALQDGSGSWNNSAADALATWNQQLTSVHLHENRASPSPPYSGDRVNSVVFSGTVFGESFGQYVLAVTVYRWEEESGRMTEADVFFNSHRQFDSYRGPTQAKPDFHRVALHEFGHLLGLDHPDQAGQSVVALMNSIIGNLDHLTDDDIAGARFLYGAVITSSLFPTSVKSGEDFSYQITTNRTASGFGASGLPPGLQLNTATGLISGNCPTSGTFQVDVTAETSAGQASGRVRISVIPRSITSGSFIQINLGDSVAYQITADNSPATYEATGLPAGVTLDTGSGLLSGKPANAGNFNIKLIARSAVSEAAGNLTLVVQPPRVTSPLSSSGTDIGGAFFYQIMATNNPTAFTASGLPAGLHLDPATGQITGVPELSGQFQVAITAQGESGTATATLVITIEIPEVADPPLKKIALYATGSVLADPIRPRVYVRVSNGIAVVDTDSLTVVKTIASSGIGGDACLSPDGSTLWIVPYSETFIQRIDLNTLTLGTDLNVSFYPRVIRAGADGRLYVTGYGQSNIFQVDSATGAILSETNPQGTNAGGSSAIEISADGKTLYAANIYVGGALSRYDISGSGAPVLLQRVNGITASYALRPLAVNPDGSSVTLLRQETLSSVTPTQVRSSQNLNQLLGYFVSPRIATQVAYNRDGSLAFQTMQERSRIDVFRTFDSQLARTITLPDNARPSDFNQSAISLAVDRTNNYLFIAASQPGISSAGLYVYSLASTPAPAAPPKTLLNVSTRLRAQPGDNALIGGFIIRGEEPKRMALRAMGPSLPIAGKLADPVLQLFDNSGALVAQNDNWNAHRSDVLATGIPPGDEHEAVITATLEAGSYTAIVSGLNNASGVALVEAYDLNPAANAKLANISTRGRVGADNNVMIGGFIIGGDQETWIVARAIGPSLENFGLAGALTDPMLEVHDGNGSLIAQDDDWRQYQEQELVNSGLAPADDREAAMLLFLQPGPYTAIVRGKNRGEGIGLVEVYNLTDSPAPRNSRPAWNTINDSTGVAR
ncbi:MAG TPA: DVUA0089 family protein [Chthoniobacterales bacterium]|jgi:hypothetical protein|nr:DVUA0089 family protein [Chthoniobacterales bacterium]